MSVPLYRVTLVREAEAAVQSHATVVRNSSDAAEILRPLFAGLDREQFVVLMLDAKHRAIGTNIVSIGSLTSAPAAPREVFKAAILSNSAAVILAHAHPSGSADPSADDIEITRRLRDCGELLGIRVLDSIILGDGTSNFYSFKDAGYF
jgi:DNA repair protein RadC